MGKITSGPDVTVGTTKWATRYIHLDRIECRLHERYPNRSIGNSVAIGFGGTLAEATADACHDLAGKLARHESI